MYGILKFTWAQKTSALRKVDPSIAIDFLGIWITDHQRLRWDTSIFPAEYHYIHILCSSSGIPYWSKFKTMLNAPGLTWYGHFCFKVSGSHTVLSSVARKALRSFKIRDPEMQDGIMITGWITRALFYSLQCFLLHVNPRGKSVCQFTQVLQQPETTCLLNIRFGFCTEEMAWSRLVMQRLAFSFCLHHWLSVYFQTSPVL